MAGIDATVSHGQLRTANFDTDMAAAVSGEKVSPESVAQQIVAGVGEDAEEVLADPTSEMVKAALPDDLKTLYPAFQAQWDAELLEAT